MEHHNHHHHRRRTRLLSSLPWESLSFELSPIPPVSQLTLPLAIDMTEEERLRSSRSQSHELPQLKDYLSFLPNTCFYLVLEQFTALELISMRSVSRVWKDAVDMRLSSIMRKFRPELAKSADEEQNTLEFRRDS